MRRIPASVTVLAPLTAALFTATPALAQPPAESCIDRHDRPVRRIVRKDLGGFAGQATLLNGEPVIYWNATNARLSRPSQIFIYLHECAHHTLGHIWKANALKWEIEADCWAAQLMWESGMLRGHHFRVIERELRTVKGDSHHLGGAALVRALQKCLDVKTDERAWAAALTAFTAASGDGFAGIQAQAIPPNGSTGRFETAIDLPGTYDCEISPEREVRCMVFAARDAKRTRNRHRALVKIIRRWLPPGWTADEELEPSDEGVAHNFVAEDRETGRRIALVATAGHRIVFTMYPPVQPVADTTPPAVASVGARTGPPGREAAEAPGDPIATGAARPRADGGGQALSGRDAGAAARPRRPEVLAIGMRVRVRVPQLTGSWITALVTRTAGEQPCLAFALARTDAVGRRQFVFLSGVTDIEVDVRGDGAMVMSGSDPAGAEWVGFPLDAARAQDTTCRRGR